MSAARLAISRTARAAWPYSHCARCTVQLAGRVGLSPAEVEAMLVALHDLGLVERCADDYRITALGRAPAATTLDA